MAERIKEVGACGNYCADCLDFRALAEDNDDLRRQVAANITKEIGREIRPEEVGCEGCWGNIHNAITASTACKIRQCVDTKGFATCAECTEFPCRTFLDQFAEDSEYANNIRAVQQVGLEKWTAAKKPNS